MKCLVLDSEGEPIMGAHFVELNTGNVLGSTNIFGKIDIPESDRGKLVEIWLDANAVMVMYLNQEIYQALTYSLHDNPEIIDDLALLQCGLA